MLYYFYLARCCDESLYAGFCMDLKEREKRHNEGKGAKYTRSHFPIKIVHHETYETRSAALRREAQVKTWTKAAKEKLVRGRSHSTHKSKLFK
ncbi:MAG: GIY-YIG nuclease family protein [Candidatus Peribacteraceae bacterium]|nr:GIY-YIG nuclease family protein [Candidatus Peribacteraceae bacterium]MDD5742895.1 GIY-YIG nuclease family protein [Candidatus Peribacteraceae bacterium]